MGNDLAQVTREVWSHYIDLNTTDRIFYALLGLATYTPLRVVAYGRQGSGKTTFLYYATKVAYTRYLCHTDHVKKDECLEHAMAKYKLCLGRDCPKDPIDEKLLSGFYVTVEDITKRFLNDVRTGEIARKPVVFFDDALTTKTWWNLGGKWRDLYHAAKTFDQFYRDHINVLVLTAPSLTYFTKEYIKNSLILYITSYFIDSTPYVVAYHFNYPYRVHYDYGRPYWVKMKELGFVDKVPIKAQYGLPTWLEQANTARRQYVLKAVAEKALRRFEEEGGEL